VTAERTWLIERLGAAVSEHSPASQVTLVALTGVTACGKTTMASELTAALTQIGRHCVNIDVDGFHNPREIRHRRGRESAEGYYYDAYNYDLLKRLVLEPLRPEGSQVYRFAGFDLDSDVFVDTPENTASPGDIFLFSASFLLRPELVSYFDFKIFVDTDLDIAERRGVARDAVKLGSAERATHMFRERYHKAQHIYFQEAAPIQHADVVVNNNDLDRPVLFFRAR